MPTEQVFTPNTLESALALLDKYGPELLVIAGGTTAMPAVKQGLSWPRYAMTLNRVGLGGVRAVNEHFEIGATTNLTSVAQIAELPVLAQAAHKIGGWAIRNMATLAGNLFVPPPAGDAAVAMLALDGQVVLRSSRAERCVPLDGFFTGLMQTLLHPDELVTGLIVDRPKGRSTFLKLARREANSPAVVSVAAQVSQDAQGKVTDARIALGAAGDYPFRAKIAEAALTGRPLDEAAIDAAAQAAVQEANPFDDALASAWYRRKMVGVYVKRALNSLAGVE
jgi:CO/xanthine dehydrogenase FAD-binding subunit